MGRDLDSRSATANLLDRSALAGLNLANITSAIQGRAVISGGTGLGALMTAVKKVPWVEINPLRWVSHKPRGPDPVNGDGLLAF